jgi:uncharacterized protein (DUF885 family)
MRNPLVCKIIAAMCVLIRSLAPLLIAILGIAPIVSVHGAEKESTQSNPIPGDSDEDLRKIIRDYIALKRASTPDDELPDRSAATLATLRESQGRLLSRLRGIDPSTLTGPSGTAYAILLENLESIRAVQVCRAELWDINHLTGWQVSLPPQISEQSVKTAAERERALRRWSSLPTFIDTDIANLRTGLARGYSVPRTVVRRVLRQVDGLLSANVDEAPFAKPAVGADDAQFEVEWRSLISQRITPAIKRFGDFLRTEYLTKARDSIGLSALANGERCYAALLRGATTLDRSPRATFDLGQATVRRSRTELRSLGRAMFGVENIGKIIQLAKTAPANRFKSSEEVISYSEAMLVRSTRMSAAYFSALPVQPIEIAPMPGYQQHSGISSHYEAVDSLTQPAFYRIDLDDWANETRGAAAVTVVHETIPGHHLQTVTARRLIDRGEASDFSFNAAYVEGWANYVERLCEEAGIYDNPYAAIFRRSVLGESLMIDPAVNVMGWTRDRVRKHLQRLGETGQEADELIDRIAVQPGQLTSYETGGLEILALREEAKAALGSQFDIREFHQRVLEQGDVPLSALRQHVRTWIRSQTRTKEP